MSKAQRASSTGLTHADLGVLALLVVAGVFGAILVVRAPPVVGRALDDGVYLVTAKALAEGKGYRHLELPGEPYQTKYPILYPLVLAPVWWVFADFPGNVTAIQILNVVLWLAGSWIAYRLMRCAWTLPWWLAAAGVVLASIASATLGVLQTAMSEPLYLLLSAGALAASAAPSNARGSGASTRSGTAWAALGGLLAAGAYLTRSIGLAVIAAVVATLLLRRRWKQAVAAAVAPVLAVVAWQAWCAYAMTSNMTNPAFEALRYDLDYRIWLPPNLAALAWVVYHNISAAALAFFEALIGAPRVWVTGLMEAGSRLMPALYLCVILTTGLTLVGLVAAWQRRQVGLHLYLLAYLTLVLAWPFEPARFFVPIMPFLMTLVLGGFRAVVVSAGRLLAGAPARWPGAVPAARLTIVLAAALAYLNVRVTVLAPGRQQLEELLSQRTALAYLVRASTPSEAVICHDQAGYLHLLTRRKFVPFLPYDDPMAHVYPGDRSFGGCGRPVTEGNWAAAMHLVNTRMIDYLRVTQARYLVPQQESTLYGAAFTEFQRSHRQYFRLLAKAGPFSLYQLRLPRS